MKSKIRNVFLILFLAVFLGGCTAKEQEVIEVETVNEEVVGDEDEKVGLANPAAVKCLEDGGTLEKVEREGGEDSDCVFPNGVRCSQWAYFRGECGTEISEKIEYMGDLLAVDRSGASGTVYVSYNGKYYLKAKLNDLTELPEGFYYEGWVVRKSPQGVISTGRAELVSGEWVNEFTDEEDLTDHIQYVLTLEPDDGDPAPDADAHVLEGVMEEI